MDNLIDFGARLKGLGGRLDYPDLYKDIFIDLEKFFLDATIYISKDSRILATVENWIYQYGFIISPSKVKRLIKSGSDYNGAVLGVFCQIINKSRFRQVNLKCLEQYLKASEREVEVLDNKPIPTRKENIDLEWIKFNLIKTKYKESRKKYLLPFSYVEKNIPEIKNRIYGVGHVESDYQSFISKEGSQYSIRKISQIINAQYPTVHQVASRFREFGLNV